MREEECTYDVSKKNSCGRAVNIKYINRAASGYI